MGEGERGEREREAEIRGTLHATIPEVHLPPPNCSIPACAACEIHTIHTNSPARIGRAPSSQLKDKYQQINCNAKVVFSCGYC